MDIREQVTQAAAEVLEPNLQFYRTDPSDTKRYFVGPEVLHAISWASTSIALPILLAGANEVVKSQVNEWLKKRKDASKPLEEPPVKLQQDVLRELEAGNDVVITPEQSKEATEAVTQYLSHRGWPKSMAASDANDIIEIMQKRAEAKNESHSC